MNKKLKELEQHFNELRAVLVLISEMKNTKIYDKIFKEMLVAEYDFTKFKMEHENEKVS